LEEAKRRGSVERQRRYPRRAHEVIHAPQIVVPDINAHMRGGGGGAD
jgi:hypothetical protein